MRTRATTMLVTTAVLTAALTACSSSNDGTDAKPSASTPATTAAPTTSTPPTGNAALEQAVKAYTAAYFKGDTDTAYGLLSKRCQGRIDRDVYAATVKQAHTDYGPDHPATGVQADVSGGLARVSYKVQGLPKFDQTGQPWTREGGAWKYDAC